MSPLRLGLVTIPLLGALGCGTGVTTIRQVLDDPARFDGTHVTIAGEVVDSANVLVLKYYKLQDATGSIAVVTQRAVPRPGARIRASGTVHQAFAIGKEQLTVLVEESAQ